MSPTGSRAARGVVSSGGRAGAWLAVALVLLLGGCAMTDPRPVLHPRTARADGEQTLVVPVDRNPANLPRVEALAREFAFGLGQRGRSAVDLAGFRDRARAAGEPVPEPLSDRLASGIVDAEAANWLRAVRVRWVIVLEVAIAEQAWTPTGKRTRIGLTARGRDLADGEETWLAHTTPEVEDEPGQGFDLATGAALAALVRVVSGEAEPFLIPRLTAPPMPSVRVPWPSVKTPW